MKNKAAVALGRRGDKHPQASQHVPQIEVVIDRAFRRQVSRDRGHFDDAVGIAHRGMASFSRVRAPVCAFAAARPPSEAPSLSAITGLPAARAALRVYFTGPGGRKLAHYVEREVTRLFAARSAPIALPSQPATPDANALPGQPASAALDGVGRRAGYAGRNRFGWNKSLSSWLGEQIGGSNGSDNALPEMRKTNAPGSHHLRSHRPPMHKL
jgi:hypothetical protein